jgi:hypothetical protein
VWQQALAPLLPGPLHSKAVSKGETTAHCVESCLQDAYGTSPVSNTAVLVVVLCEEWSLLSAGGLLQHHEAASCLQDNE